MAENTASKIPDVWYDVYARLLPGVYFCLSLLLLRGYALTTLSWDNIVLLLVSGFLIGHIAQPITSFFAGRIREHPRKNKRKNSKKPESINQKREILLGKKNWDHSSRQALVLSKQHAELSRSPTHKGDSRIGGVVIQAP